MKIEELNQSLSPVCSTPNIIQFPTKTTHLEVHLILRERFSKATVKSSKKSQISVRAQSAKIRVEIASLQPRKQHQSTKKSMGTL